MANAKQHHSGQPSEGEGGRWSFFTLPAAKMGTTAPSTSTPPAAVAATAASMQGALASWMIMSVPSAKKDAASKVATPAPSTRISSSKLPVREGVKETRKTAPTALLAFASAIKTKERTIFSPAKESASARRRESRAKVASLKKAPLNNSSNKASEDARPTSSSPPKPSTAYSKAPNSSGQLASWARRAKSQQEQGQGHGPSRDARTVSPGAGRGKVAAFISSVAATGWFLFRTSTSGGSSAQPPHAKHERWSNPFADLNANAPANTRHPSWSASTGNTDHGSQEVHGDVRGRADARAEGENAQQGDAADVDTRGVGKSDVEREAGVWVGWGGGCAF